jgi:hypothetical protein
MSVLVSHYAQASNDALTNGQTLHDIAEQLRNDCTTTTDNSVISHYTPGSLRYWADTERQAEKAFSDMVRFMQCRNNVLEREYAHRCLTALRNVVARCVLVLQTLRQLSASFDRLLPTACAPPGQLFARCVLATCCASNAPGLSPIAMNYWQVRLKE